jgi:hypothetical protein
MLHNPTVLAAHVAAGFWLKPSAPENMPAIAAQLAGGPSAASSNGDGRIGCCTCCCAHRRRPGSAGWSA